MFTALVDGRQLLFPWGDPILDHFSVGEQGTLNFQIWDEPLLPFED